MMKNQLIMSQSSFYQNRINAFSASLGRMKRFNLLFIILKISLFTAILVMLYYWMVHQVSILWADIGMHKGIGQGSVQVTPETFYSAIDFILC